VRRPARKGENCRILRNYELLRVKKCAVVPNTPDWVEATQERRGQSPLPAFDLPLLINIHYLRKRVTERLDY
jgi:hypothetical protein